MMKMGVEMPEELVEMLRSIRDELAAIRRLMESSGSATGAAPMRPAATPAPRASAVAIEEPPAAPRWAEPEPEPEPVRAIPREPAMASLGRMMNAPVVIPMPEPEPAPAVESAHGDSPNGSDAGHDAAIMKMISSLDIPTETESRAATQPPMPIETDTAKFDLSMDDLEKIFGLDKGRS